MQVSQQNGVQEFRPSPLQRAILALVERRGSIGAQSIITHMRRAQGNVGPRQIDEALRGLRQQGVLASSGPSNRLTYSLGQRMLPPDVTGEADIELDPVSCPEPGLPSALEPTHVPVSATEPRTEPRTFRCNACGHEKSELEFSPTQRNRAENGIWAHCRACKAEYNRVRNARIRKEEHLRQVDLIQKSVGDRWFVSSDLRGVIEAESLGPVLSSLVGAGLLDHDKVQGYRITGVGIAESTEDAPRDDLMERIGARIAAQATQTLRDMLGGQPQEVAQLRAENTSLRELLELRTQERDTAFRERDTALELAGTAEASLNTLRAQLSGLLGPVLPNKEA